ncbi:MAG: phosphonate C-P lyase system protein PhnH [Clostridiales bacterium]|jgi:alpha-D-ribose 1-methylphosphonate 5-triphosphate synthase subunit PhnH|nr:phosphonate C-P lyase system protein PhnH [Clostridiales bacterium]
MSALLKKHSFDTVFDSQQVFRLILDAIAHPGRIINISCYHSKFAACKDGNLPPAGAHCVSRQYGDYPEFLAMAMTLLDNEVSYNTCDNHYLADEIMSLTLAKQATVGDADFIFVCDPKDIDDIIANAKCGTLSDPHKSSTVVIHNSGEHVYRLRLSGPGINSHTEVPATLTVREAIKVRDAQNYEYPQGIDLFFLSSEGDLFAIPRLTHMEVL